MFANGTVYPEHRKGLCPSCGEDGNPEGGAVYIEDGYAYQNCYCTECGAAWEDSYKLFSYIITEEGVKHEESI